MVDTKSDIHPALDRLVADIAANFKSGDRPADNYLDRRLALISELEAGTLRNVDEQLHEALRSVEMNDEKLHVRLIGWAHVLKVRSLPSD